MSAWFYVWLYSVLALGWLLVESVRAFGRLHQLMVQLFAGWQGTINRLRDAYRRIDELEASVPDDDADAWKRSQ